MKNAKTIIYVNYSPYENSGKILDFMLENFHYVFLFSIGFHKLQNNVKFNQLLIYKNKKQIKNISLFQLPVSEGLIFFLLPIKSLINFFEILFYSYKLSRKYGVIDNFFSVNGFTGWIGLIMKKFGIVNNTIFWVWDYYPPIHRSKLVTVMRQLYWNFDKISSNSDKVVFLNHKLLKLRQDVGIIPANKKFLVVPIGTDRISFKVRNKKKAIFGFIGVVKKSQGLDIIFDNSEMIHKYFPNAQFHIVGSGPDEEYFKKKAKYCSLKVIFHGFLEGETFNRVLSKCSIGLATYEPDKSNVSIYGDPGKVKRYLSLGLPVIATDVFEFVKEIKRKKAGIIIDYNNSKQLVSAIKKILANYKRYSDNALKLSYKYYYRNIYPSLFKF